MSKEERIRVRRKFVKRAPNYSDNEKRFLVDRILKAYPVILDKRVDTRAKQEKTRAWELLAAEFNSHDCFVNRNPTTLRTCWENLKRLKKNDCVRSVLEPHLPPKKQETIPEESVEIIDLDEQKHNDEDKEIDAKETLLTVEVKIDEDIFFIPNETVVNTQQENVSKNQQKNKDPLSETVENVAKGDAIKDWSVDSPPTSAPMVKKKEPAKAKKRAVRRLRVIKKRPVSIHNMWIKKEIELFRTLKKHAEEYGKMLAKKRIELFQTLKHNAEEEGKLKRMILLEQLKQEKIKTVKLENLV